VLSPPRELNARFALMIGLSLVAAGATSGSPARAAELAGAGSQFWRAADIDAGAPAAESFGQAVAVGDFDNDGRLDLAIGDPLANSKAGAVYVLYGAYTGLEVDPITTWTQDTGLVENQSEPNDRFGYALVSGNFDGDNFDDLAIGAPGETINAKAEAGAVNVLFGSGSGLTDTGNQFLHPDRTNVIGVSEAGGNYGHALAAGNFDGDVNSYDDLAIGHPGANSGGIVQVFYGTTGDLRNSIPDEQQWDQSFLQDLPEAGDRFGNALTAGDFDNDGKDDLIIGVPFEDLPPQSGGNGTDVGALHLVLGAAGGLTSTGNQFWHERVGSVLGGHDGSEQFGSAFAAGDFDNDGNDDLAIGAPGEPLGSGANAGWINVLYGAAFGLTDVGNQAFSQGFGGLLGSEGAGHRFGQALVVGDFNDDGTEDIAVGAPGDVVASAAGAGSVHVIYGTGSGLSAAGNQYWNQDDALVDDAPEAAEGFGSALASGDFDQSGADDLAIGVPLELEGGPVGAVNVLYTDGPCGNGVVEAGEECDDGNRLTGDTCTPLCLAGAPPLSPYFGAPALLNSNAATDAGHESGPQLATDGLGTWIVVWESTATLGGTIGSDSDILFARSTDAGATWTAPAPVDAGANMDADADVDPRLATDGAGTWIAAWQRELDVRIARSTDGGVSWTPPEVVEPSPVGLTDLAADGDGGWMLGWVDLSNEIFAVPSTDGGVSWGPKVLVGGARFASPAPGSWVVAGTIGSDVGSSTSTDSGLSWSNPVSVTGSPGVYYSPVIAADAAGRVRCAYTSESDVEIHLSESIDSGSSWNLAETFSIVPPALSIVNNLAADGAGTWRTGISAYINGSVPLVAHSRDGAPGETSMGWLGTSGIGTVVAADGAGHWVAVWVSSDPLFVPGSDTEILFATGSDPDTDNDGLADHVETNVHGTDPGNPDSDSDGLTDGEEILSHGTNPLDDDSDDDGILDGNEVGSPPAAPAGGGSAPEGAGATTDPLLADSDGDGVQDGTEQGLTAPQGSGTDLGVFVPDADPSTTTDPNNSDSDGDGQSDGEEDLDGNGRFDPGETDPNDASNSGVPAVPALAPAALFGLALLLAAIAWGGLRRREKGLA